MCNLLSFVSVTETFEQLQHRRLGCINAILNNLRSDLILFVSATLHLI